MIEIVYPVYQDNETEIENTNANKFNSLKIAGDFNNWQIEPMVQSKLDSKPVWIYQIKDSLLSNCKNLNDKNEILIHFKFIDDNNNWFIVPDYASEPDEHNNINNVKVAKPKDINEDAAEEAAETEVVNDGPESPEPSLKDEKLKSVEPIIETPKATPDVPEPQVEENIVIEEEDDDDVENTESNDTPEQEEEHPIDIPDEVIEEPDSMKEDSVPLPDINNNHNNNGSTTNNDNILEECPEDTPDIITTTTTEKNDDELDSKSLDSSKDEDIKQSAEVKKEDNVTPEETAAITTTKNMSNEIAADEHTEEPDVITPNKLEESDSHTMLENPVAQVALSETEGNVEHRDVAVKNKNTEEYQNVLRRLLKGFCSWFSWLFGIFHSQEGHSH